MDKLDINLTDDEKIDFMANLKNNPIDRFIDDKKVVIFGIYGIIALSVLIATFVGPAMGLFSFTLNYLFSVAAVFGLGTLFMAPKVVRLLKDKKEFKTLSNGKITYKEFKALKKSGVIKEWKTKFSKEIETKALEKAGVTIEIYTKDTEMAIIEGVKDILNYEQIARLDSERIANEVKKIIDENNDRQK